MKKSWLFGIHLFFCFNFQIAAHENVAIQQSDLAVIVVSLKILWVTLGSVGVFMLAGQAFGCLKGCEISSKKNHK